MITKKLSDLVVSEIGDFFAGRAILITGGTGFLGAVLLEKLLRDCPKIETIYLLIRPKGDTDVQDRTNSLFKTALFSKHDQESIKKKVVAMSGDVSKPGLGLNSDDRCILLCNVSVVFHAAATIKFNAALKNAINTNLMGTKRILHLCLQMPNIKAFVYVSTAYCNCMLGRVLLEQVYPCEHDPNEVIETVRRMTSREAQKSTPSWIKGHPNTYSFSKHLAENLVKRERNHIPVAIVRPTLVLGTLKEPFPGWIDNMNTGGFAFIAGAGKGVFRVSCAERSCVADLVPCDYVANLLIASAWRAAVDRNSLQVYHCSTASTNPLTWGEYTDHVINLVRKHPSEEMLWYPSAKCRVSLIRIAIIVFFLQLIPALAVKIFTKFMSRPDYMLISIQQKFCRGIKHIKYFTKRQWYFDVSNTSELAKMLTPTDHQLFDFDTTHINWYTFLESTVLGIRQHFHKEHLRTLPRARKFLKWFLLLHLAVHVVIFVVTLMLAAFLLDINLVYSAMLATFITALFIWI